MNVLPDELISFILNQLSLDDILNCKLVNKQFYSIIVNHVRIKDELVVSDCDYLPLNRRWFYTYHFISLYNLIKFECLDQIEFMLNQSIISNQLKQFYVYESCISFKLLNHFKRLEQLEIVKSFIQNEHGENILKLPNLKIFFIRFLHLPESHLRSKLTQNLVFDLPNLRKLKIDGFHEAFEFSLKDATNLSHLELKHFSNSSKFIESAINLEYFYCEHLEEQDLKGNLLEKFEKLKSISLNYYCSHAFVAMKRQREEFNRNFKIYYLGIECSCLPSDPFSKLELIAFYANNNKHLQDKIQYITTLNYNNRLLEYLNQLPNDFLNRLVNLNRLEVEIEDANQLAKILKDCKTIISLKLPATLDQSFYDNMFSLNSNIERLDIFGDAILNLEFIFKFKHLKTFRLDKQLPIEFVIKFLETFKIIDSFSFRHKQHGTLNIAHPKYDYLYLLIRNLPNSIFYCSTIDRLLLELASLDEADDPPDELSILCNNPITRTFKKIKDFSTINCLSLNFVFYYVFMRRNASN